MTGAGEKIADLIRRDGPIRFSQFMEIALYDKECGYYTNRSRDPFGKEGDFYTAAQLQPVAGRLVASAIRRISTEMNLGDDVAVVEWGAGRGEMGQALRDFRYFGVDVGSGEPPASFSGVVFSNELFDALPVDVAKYESGEWRAMRVGVDAERFVWRESEALDDVSFGPPLEDRHWVELPVNIRGTMQEMTRGLRRGAVIAIDYGITERERVRFPRGTLMSYRRHQAIDDVLASPGEQDITAHVPFDYLDAVAQDCGLASDKLITLAQWILSLGEEALEAALAAGSEKEASRLRLQLKTLLVGMGETFRVAVWRKP